MKIEQINNIRDLEDIKSEWEALFVDAGEISPYLTYEYLFNWMMYVEKYIMPVLLLVRNEKLIGIVPIFIKKNKKFGISFNRLTFPVKGTMPPFDFLILKEHKKEVIKCVLDYLRFKFNSWDMAILEEIHEESDTIKIVSDLARPLKIKCFTNSGLSRYVLPIKGDYDSYFRNLSGNLKRNLKRYKKYCNESGHLDFLHVTSEYENLQSVLDWLPDILNKSWKRVDKKENGFLNFLTNYINDVFKKGRLSLWFMLIDGKPVCFLLETVICKNIYAFYCAYNLDYHHLSPGTILFNESIKYAFNNKFNMYVIDGYKDYLSKWTKKFISYKNLILIYPRVSSQLKGTVYLKIKDRLKNKAKSAANDRKERYIKQNKEKSVTQA